MAKLVTIKYVGPFDEVTVDQDGFDRTFVRGAEERVPAALAGHAPIAPASEDDPGDPGAGLLAQTDNWQEVTSKASSAEKE